MMPHSLPAGTPHTFRRRIGLDTYAERETGAKTAMLIDVAGALFDARARAEMRASRRMPCACRASACFSRRTMHRPISI